MNDKFSLRDYPLKAASLYVSALSFILENTIGCGFLYRANTVINDVSFSQVIVNERASDLSVQVRCHSSA